MLRTPLVALLAVGAAFFASATPALADPIDDAVAALQTSSIYVGADQPKIDSSTLRDKLDGIKVAIVPIGGPAPGDVAASIGERLDSGNDPLTVVVFEGKEGGVRSTAYCDTGPALTKAIDAHLSELRSSDNVTSTIVDFIGRLPQLPRDTNGCDAGS